MLDIFVDGQHGTTGLEIHRLLADRAELRLLTVDAEQKKDPAVRRQMLNDADAVVLCLPDDAAIEAVRLIDSPRVRVVDASTAHRVAAGWHYGLAELPGQRGALQGARRVANPGCYPTGFLLAVRPLIDAGLIPRELPLTVHAISGYSGGGRKMIDAFEARARSAPSPDALAHGQLYGLGLQHKHVPEMTAYAGCSVAPLFVPSVGHFYRGMLVCIPLFTSQLRGPPGSPAAGKAIGRDLVRELWLAAYANEPAVRVLAHDSAPIDGYLDPQHANGFHGVELMVFGHAEQLLLVARLDNLGKGAAGAAVQNLNLMLGLPEFAGLTCAAATRATAHP